MADYDDVNLIAKVGPKHIKTLQDGLRAVLAKYIPGWIILSLVLLSLFVVTHWFVEKRIDLSAAFQSPYILAYLLLSPLIIATLAIRSAYVNAFFTYGFGEDAILFFGRHRIIRGSIFYKQVVRISRIDDTYLAIYYQAADSTNLGRPTSAIFVPLLSTDSTNLEDYLRKRCPRLTEV